MEHLSLAFGFALYLAALLLFAQKKLLEVQDHEALPTPPTGPPPSTAVVQQQQRASAWTKLARTQGWPIEVRELDARRSQLDLRWGEKDDALFIRVLKSHSQDQATETPSFSMRCRRPQKGLIDNRRLLSQALSWQGVDSERRVVGKWFSKLPGPQELSWEPKDILGSVEGRLHLSLPATTSDLSEIRAGLRALRTALQQARAPAWASLAHERGWHLGFDATKTLPLLAGRLDGVPFRATLRKTREGLQTQISSIAVPELLPELYIVHAAHGEGEAAELNHPIAGSTLHASGPHLAAMRLLVNNPQVFGALMAVVHGHPGSSLSGDRIELLAERDLKLELLPAIEQVAALSKALEAHYTPARSEPGA